MVYDLYVHVTLAEGHGRDVEELERVLRYVLNDPMGDLPFGGEADHLLEQGRRGKGLGESPLAALGCEEIKFRLRQPEVRPWVRQLVLHRNDYLNPGEGVWWILRAEDTFVLGVDQITAMLEAAEPEKRLAHGFAEKMTAWADEDSADASVPRSPDPSWTTYAEWSATYYF